MSEINLKWINEKIKVIQAQQIAQTIQKENELREKTREQAEKYHQEVKNEAERMILSFQKNLECGGHNIYFCIASRCGSSEVKVAKKRAYDITQEIKSMGIDCVCVFVFDEETTGGLSDDNYFAGQRVEIMLGLP